MGAVPHVWDAYKVVNSLGTNPHDSDISLQELPDKIEEAATARKYIVEAHIPHGYIK